MPKICKAASATNVQSLKNKVIFSNKSLFIFTVSQLSFHYESFQRREEKRTEVFFGPNPWALNLLQLVAGVFLCDISLARSHLLLYVSSTNTENSYLWHKVSVIILSSRKISNAESWLHDKKKKEKKSKNNQISNI